MRKNHFAMLCIVALSLVLAPRTTAQTTDDGWVIPATSKANYCGVTLANGRIGIVSQPTLFGVSDIVLNGVYDMNSDHGGVSRIVRGPVFTNLRLTIGGTYSPTATPRTGTSRSTCTRPRSPHSSARPTPP